MLRLIIFSIRMNYYLMNKIEENYEQLKIEASNLDAKIKDVVSNSGNKSIVVSDNMFKYLEKYGLQIYSLDEDNTDVNAVYNDVLKMVNNGSIKYVFVKDNEEDNQFVQKLIQTGRVTIQNWHTLANLTETEKTGNDDYFTLMNANLELLKNELYK